MGPFTWLRRQLGLGSRRWEAKGDDRRRTAHVEMDSLMEGWASLQTKLKYEWALHVVWHKQADAYSCAHLNGKCLKHLKEMMPKAQHNI